jgi:NADH-ubiquinone oxidoreductase chain 2
MISIEITDNTILDKSIGIFSGLFNSTPLTQIFKTFIYGITSVILLLTSFFPRKYKSNPIISNIATPNSYLASIVNNKGWFKDTLHKDKKYLNTFFLGMIFNKMSEQFRIIEYSLIMLLALSGVIFLISNSDLISLFLCIELQSYGLYLICTTYKNSELATSAGLTYFLLGGLASCFILLGIGLLYTNSANVNLDGLYVINNLSNIIDENSNNWYESYYISYSLLILSIGLLFKISAAPFHIWSPDVYDNVPTIVTTFVAIVPKLSILIIMLELVHYTGNIYLGTNITWTASLLLSSFFSLIIGTVLGLSQSRIKRLFAYSTISHLGFILLALSVNTIESSQSFIFYLMQYTISNLNAFILMLSMGYALFFYRSDNIEYNKLQEKNNSPIQLTNQIKGYHNISPILTLSFTITLFSFVGIPPLIGFFAKQMVLSSALDKGYVFLVLIAILTSVIAAVYYLGIIKKMYFDEHDYLPFELKMDNNIENSNKTILKKDDNLLDTNIYISNYLSITISIITLLVLIFILVPQEFMNLSNILTLVLYVSK